MVGQFPGASRRTQGEGTLGNESLVMLNDLSPPPDPIIRWRSETSTAFDAWAPRQLDLESKPPDSRGVLRGGIRTHLKRLTGSGGKVLYSTYTAPTLVAGSDVENVLFTNVDPIGSPFRRVARAGVVFEFVPRDPSGTVGVAALKCSSSYEMDEPGRPPVAWEEGDVVMEWTRIAVPSLKTATRSGPVWWDLRSGMTSSLGYQGRPPFYSVQMVLHGPRDMEVNTAAKVKVVIDAAVLSLCSENGLSAVSGIQAFAARSGLDAERVHQLMIDTSVAVFGPCAMVTKSGQAKPPDTGCVHGSLLAEPGSADRWLLSGKVLSLKPKLA